MSLRILVYTDAAGIYGLAQYNQALLCGIARKRLTALSAQKRETNALTEQRTRLGVESLWLDYDPAADFQRSLTDVAGAQCLLERADPDVILFSNSCPLSNFAAKRAAMHLDIPFVVLEGKVAASCRGEGQAFVDELAAHWPATRQVVVERTTTNWLLSGRNLACLRTKGCSFSKAGPRCISLLRIRRCASDCAMSFAFPPTPFSVSRRLAWKRRRGISANWRRSSGSRNCLFGRASISPGPEQETRCENKSARP